MSEAQKYVNCHGCGNMMEQKGFDSFCAACHRKPEHKQAIAAESEAVGTFFSMIFMGFVFFAIGSRFGDDTVTGISLLVGCIFGITKAGQKVFAIVFMLAVIALLGAGAWHVLSKN